MNYTAYYPEMGAKDPNADIEAKICIYPSGHYRLKTRLELRGRGVAFGGVDMNNDNIYTVTKRAFEKICRDHSVAMPIYLD